MREGDGPLCDRWGPWVNVGWVEVGEVEEERTEEDREGEEEEDRLVGG